MGSGTRPSRFRARPLGVTLLAVWEVISGIQLLITGLALLSLSSDQEQGPVKSVLLILGLVFVLIAISYFLWARGYLRGYENARRRGRFAAVAVIILAILASMLLGNAVRLFFDAPLWTIFANIVIALYLGRPRVKAFFASR